MVLDVFEHFGIQIGGQYHDRYSLYCRCLAGVFGSGTSAAALGPHASDLWPHLSQMMIAAVKGRSGRLLKSVLTFSLRLTSKIEIFSWRQREHGVSLMPLDSIISLISDCLFGGVLYSTRFWYDMQSSSL